MPEFIMDRDGVVNGMTFDDLSDIFQGYIECMLFTETAGHISMVEWASEEVQEALREGTSDGSIPGDSGWGDISPESAETAQLDVMRFESQARALLDEAYATGEYDAAQAGRDFWFTRNGHGCGFWDRKELEGNAWEKNGSPQIGEPGWDAYMTARDNSIGRQLTAIAETFGEVYVSFDPDESSPTGYGYVNMS